MGSFAAAGVESEKAGPTLKAKQVRLTANVRNRETMATLQKLTQIRRSRLKSLAA
jgi:hypothetical protein